MASIIPLISILVWTLLGRLAHRQSIGRKATVAVLEGLVPDLEVLEVSVM